MKSTAPGKKTFVPVGLYIMTACMLMAQTFAFATGSKEAASPVSGPGSGQARESAPVIAVSILPQGYLLGRIAGDRVRPLVLVGAGQSPHAYEPTPRQMAELSAARMWFTINVDFEKALQPKVASLYPGMAIIDTTATIQYRRLEAHDHDDDSGDHDDGEHDEDDHGDVPGGRDQHVWLGRQAALAMAQSMKDALSAFDPAGAAVYEANHAALVRDIVTTFEDLKRDLAPLAGSTVLVYHPAFGYFLDEFGLNQEAVETGGKEPTQKALAAMMDKARAYKIRTIFVQAQFPTTAATTVAKAIGGSVLTIDPLAPDWLDNLRRMGAALKEGLR